MPQARAWAPRSQGGRLPVRRPRRHSCVWVSTAAATAAAGCCSVFAGCLQIGEEILVGGVGHGDGRVRESRIWV